MVKSATRGYARDNDTVVRFVEEQCVRADPEKVRTMVAALREAYEWWCEQAGERTVNPKRLAQELRGRFGIGEARGTKGRRYYTRLALAEFGSGQGSLVEIDGEPPR